MTNREHYKRAFQALQPSEGFSMEVMDMKRNDMKFSTPRAIVVAALIAILTVGTLTAAFAADLGGIRQAATIWVQGKPREALVSMEEDEVIVEIGEGETHSFRGNGVAMDADEFTVTDDTVASYTVTWQDEDGEPHSFSGGGVTLDADGTQQPITVEEVIDYLNSPSVDETEDGRMIASWYDQAEDITDRFEDGVCRVSLEHDGETVYMIVQLNGDGGFGVSYGNDGFEALEADLAEGARLEAEEEE